MTGFVEPRFRSRLFRTGSTYKIAVDGYYYGYTGNVTLNWGTVSAQQMASWAPVSSEKLNEATFSLPSSEQRALDVQEAAQRDGEFKALTSGVSALTEETCDEPAAANYGEVISYDENGNETTTQTYYLSLPKPSTPNPNPNAPPPSCPQSLAIQHKIVTVNTPRTRDLPGKLYIRLKSGDPSIVDVTHNGSAYTLGSPINVVEYGHSGCGVHDWHYGYDNFEFTGITKGEVVFEVECDPDPDDGGDGAATKKLELTIKVFELTFIADAPESTGIPATTEWGGQDGHIIPATANKQKITVITDPAEVAPLITLELQALDEEINPEYTPSGIGSITQQEATVWEYSSFTEPKTAKAARDKFAIVVAKIDNDLLCADYRVLVKPVFDWLNSYHQHGPGEGRHPTQASDREIAWRYARWKYDIVSSNLANISYTPSGNGNAETDITGPRGARNCLLHAPAFSTENWCASDIGHENVHGGQSFNPFLKSWARNLFGTFDRKIEYPAYKWQADNAEKCGLSASETQDVIDNMNRTKNGESPE